MLTVYPKATAAAGVDQSLCQVANGPTALAVTGTFTDGAPAKPAWSVVATGMAAATIVRPNSAATNPHRTSPAPARSRYASTVNRTPSPRAGTDDVVLTVTPLPVATITASTAVCRARPATQLPCLMQARARLQLDDHGRHNHRRTRPRTITWTAGNARHDIGDGDNGGGLQRKWLCAGAINANPTAVAGVDQTLCQTLPGPTDFTVTGKCPAARR